MKLRIPFMTILSLALLSIMNPPSQALRCRKIVGTSKNEERIQVIIIKQYFHITSRRPKELDDFPQTKKDMKKMFLQMEYYASRYINIFMDDAKENKKKLYQESMEYLKAQTTYKMI